MIGLEAVVGADTGHGLGGTRADRLGMKKEWVYYFAWRLQDKDSARGRAFSVKVMVTPTVTFEERQAKSASLGAVKTEGSTLALAVVASLMTFDKASGVLSRAVVAEINKFLFERCKDEGVEIPRR